MKYYSQYRNHDLFDLQELLSRFCKSNRWVKLGDNLPWDNIVREYNKRLQYRHAGADNKTASYSLAMGYDNMHRITSKKQHLSQTGVQFGGTLHAGYELAYTYGSAEGKKFQLDNVRDINYRTEETPTERTNINNGHKYIYDANGNLVYINTSRVKRDGKEDEKATEQKYKWDEENRLLAADENGFVSNYWYDADGERTVKTSGENEAIYVNSEFSGGKTGTTRFSLYVSPYLVAGQGGKYTKHIYVGSQRIVSKLGDLASYGADPRRIPYAGKEADGLTINYKDKYNQQLQSIKDNYKAFDQPYNGQDNDDYVNGQGFCCNDATPEAAQVRVMNASTRSAVDNNFHDKDNYEKMQFFYHPDHLGSSSYITNLDGEVSQHIEYVPFGEVFIEERNNTWNTPYLFNAKELDEETGMYYYGARYYEPRLSLWMSCDPLEEKYPNISSYDYCMNNPVKFIDPDGKKLKLAGNRQQRIKILTYLQKLTNDKLGVRQDGIVLIMKTGVRNTNKKLTTGTGLISNIVKSNKQMTIEIGKIGSTNYETDVNSTNATNGKGTNVKVNFDISANPLIPTKNSKTGNVSDQNRPNEIGLAHEMIHGERSMKGKAIDYSIKSSYTYKDVNGKKTSQMVPQEELETVGLKGNNTHNENNIRKEQGLKQRGAY